MNGEARRRRLRGAEERGELANTAVGPLSLGGWRLRDAAGNEVVFDEGAVLAGTTTSCAARRADGRRRRAGPVRQGW